MRKFFPILIFILGALKTSAQSPPLIMTDYIYPEKRTTLESFLKREVGVPKDVLYEEGYLEKIREWNPHLRDETLSKGEEVYLELPYGTRLTPNIPESDFRMTSSFEEEPEQLEQVEESSSILKGAVTEREEQNHQKSWQLMGLYTLSTGLFDQENSQAGVSASSQQNSPISLGVMTSYDFSPTYNLAASLYFSKLTSTSSNLDSSIDVPLEYGVNTYLTYAPKRWEIAPYGGLDYERFSTFNISELNEGEDPTSIEHNIAYFTLGVGTQFEFFNRIWSARASASQSLHSSASRSISESGDTFSGQRFLFFLGTRGKSNWSYHALFKQHFLSDGIEDLKITRIGLGFGFSFF